MLDDDECNAKVIWNVRLAAAAAGFETSTALADATGIARPTLFRRMTGVTAFKVAELIVIARACGIPSGELVRFE